MGEGPHRGTLEGIESCEDSVGLGKRRVVFCSLPSTGRSFTAWIEGNEHRPPLITSTGQRWKSFGDSEIRFMTKNTTYILTVDSEEVH